MKLGSDTDLVKQFYAEVRLNLKGSMRTNFFAGMNFYIRAAMYYMDYLKILMLTKTPKAAHQETKNRALVQVCI